MASAVVVNNAAQVVGLVPASVSRTGDTCLGGQIGATNPKKFSAAQKQRKTSWRPLAVTNAAPTLEWKTKREALLKAKARFMVRSVTPKDALQLQQEQGYTIIDVRPENEFNSAHPAGAINVQVYRLIEEWTLWDISRRVVFAIFGMFHGTERNTEFLTEVKAVLKEDDKIIVACLDGGTMKPTPNLAEGSQSRSLIAAYLLILDGFTNVVHVEGGLRQWFKQDLPTESEDKELSRVIVHLLSSLKWRVNTRKSLEL